MEQPIVLLDIPGFGISSSWKGNAIASADPKNFNSLWRTHFNAVLSPLRNETASSFDNKGIYLEALLSGVSVKSNQELINNEISSEGIYDNAVVDASLTEVTKSNSSIHFVGNLGGPGNEFGDINHLISLLKIAKQKNIYKVYLHLILDNSEGTNFDQVVDRLNLLRSKLETIGIGEIATIIGSFYLQNWYKSRLEYANFLKGIRALIQGRGNIYLSPDQAISQNKTKVSSPDRFPPSVISYKGRPVGTISDLDCVIFFNHNNENISNLISALMSRGGRNDFSAPKFLSVLTFFDYVLPREPHLRTILSRQFYEDIPLILDRNKISQIYISDSNRLLELKSLLNKGVGEEKIEQAFYPVAAPDEYYKDPKPAILEIFKHTANGAGSGHRFTFAHIPALDVIASNGNFNQAIVATRIIDDYLVILAKKILSLDGKLIITSSYGNAEKMVHRNGYELLNHRTLSPTPFLLISNQTEAKTMPASIENEAMYDIIRKKNNLIDIAPTVLGLLNLPIPNSMTGKNLVGVKK